MKRRKDDSLAAEEPTNFFSTGRISVLTLRLRQRTTPARGEVVEAAPLFYIARFSFPSSDGKNKNRLGRAGAIARSDRKQLCPHFRLPPKRSGIASAPFRVFAF
jgi:hypothetical protein